MSGSNSKFTELEREFFVELENNDRAKSMDKYNPLTKTILCLNYLDKKKKKKVDLSWFFRFFLEYKAENILHSFAWKMCRLFFSP